MTTPDSTTHLERQLSSLFRAEAQNAHLPSRTWETLFPKMGNPDRQRLFERFKNAVGLPTGWSNPLRSRYAAPVATVALAALAALLFVLLVNDDDGGDGPSPAGSPTVPVETRVPPTVTPDVTVVAIIGATPTVTPSQGLATPMPTEMQIVFVDDFGSPVSGSAFEDLLARLPDNTVTRRLARLSDFAGPLELVGLNRPPPGSDSETLEAFAQAIFASEIDGFRPEFPDWPSEMRAYVSLIDWYQSAGFDFMSVDQYAVAGHQFGVDPSGDEGFETYDVALGQFDPALTASALAACECDQPDIRSHSGIEFYSWGESGIGNLRMRLEPPLYDYVGRGPRLLVRDGEAYWAIQDAAMEGFTETLSGSAPPLGDDQDYLEAVRLILTLGVTKEIAIKSSDMDVESVSQINNPDVFRDLLRETPLLDPFGVAATSDGFDGERMFSGLVIAHEDEDAARANLDALLVRLREGRLFPNATDTWANVVEKAEFSVQGKFIVGRLYFNAPGRRLSLVLGNSLVVHE